MGEIGIKQTLKQRVLIRRSFKPIYLFNWTRHLLKTSNKRTYIPLLMNLFLALIELDIY